MPSALCARGLYVVLWFAASRPSASLRTQLPQDAAPWGPEVAAEAPSVDRHGPYETRHGPYETRESLQSAHKSDEELARVYDALGFSLAGAEGLSHSAHILKYVAARPEAPQLSPGGCLYLPHNSVWKEFYEHIAHPYPPLFAEMIAASFYPGCQRVSLSGKEMQGCGGGTESGFLGESSRCIGTRFVADSSNITVMVSDGIVGIAAKWRNHLNNQAQQRRLAPERHGDGHGSDEYKEHCGNAGQLREIPAKQRLVVPARYVVCTTDGNHRGVDEAMIRAQNEWTNDGYAGRAPWNQQEFEKTADKPPQVDMQIQFELKGVKFVTDSRCAKESFYDYSAVLPYIDRSSEQVTIVLTGDDQSGILGMSPLPMDFGGNDSTPVVLVSRLGLRNFALKAGGDMTYNEGDTVTHEAGHFFGLYHTFQDGCSGGDLITDTEPEEFPHYSCTKESSCGTPDPIHNFMDYTPDACMAGFTEQQKRRAWCVIEKYRPGLFRSSLRLEK